MLVGDIDHSRVIIWVDRTLKPSAGGVTRKNKTRIHKRKAREEIRHFQKTKGALKPATVPHQSPNVSVLIPDITSFISTSLLDDRDSQPGLATKDDSCSF